LNLAEGHVGNQQLMHATHGLAQAVDNLIQIGDAINLKAILDRIGDAQNLVAFFGSGNGGPAENTQDHSAKRPRF